MEIAALLIGRHLSLITNPDRRHVGRLDRVSYTLLTRLAADPLTIADLSRVLGVDLSTVNRRTAGLVRAGVLERFPDPDGGIARRFRLTAAGRRLLVAEQRANLRGLGMALRDWSASDLADLAQTARTLQPQSGGGLRAALEGLNARRAGAAPQPKVTTTFSAAPGCGPAAGRRAPARRGGCD